MTKINKIFLGLGASIAASVSAMADGYAVPTGLVTEAKTAISSFGASSLEIAGVVALAVLVVAVFKKIF